MAILGRAVGACAASFVPGALLSIAVLLSGCASTPVAAQSSKAVSGTDVIAAYAAAINRRDLVVLPAYVTPDVEWYSVVDGTPTLEVTGREALVAALGEYFKNNARTRLSLEPLRTVGNLVAVVERSEWSEDGATQSRSSLGVFELSDGRIRRISYYLAE